MGKCLSDLPNELLGKILFYLIEQPWENDVCDFLSFTSTCRLLHQFVADQRYWQIMAKRRDPSCDIPPENNNWFDYCKQIFWQRTIPGEELIESISRFNEDYFCTIQKVLIWPNKLRLYIDERGDNSLGSIQNPKSSVILIVHQISAIDYRRDAIFSNGGEFSIANRRSQYLGYLEFPYRFSQDSIDKLFIFRYGTSGYTDAGFFRLDRNFILKYNLMKHTDPR